MGRRRGTGRTEATGGGQTAPFPITPLDLLAGIGPGVELHAGEPDGDVTAEGGDPRQPVTTTVAETGKLLRAGDSTIRRLIRTPVLRPAERGDDEPSPEPERAGVVPRTPRRPGE